MMTMLKAVFTESYHNKTSSSINRKTKFSKQESAMEVNEKTARC